MSCWIAHLRLINLTPGVTSINNAKAVEAVAGQVLSSSTIFYQLQAAIPFSHLWSASVLILAQELHHHGWFWPQKCLSLKRVSFEKVTSLKMAMMREGILPVFHKPMNLRVFLSTSWEESLCQPLHVNMLNR